MALDPMILFLDEPSAGLDPITSAELDALIRRLARDLGVTFVIVTHELPSIFAIADRVIMLDKRKKGIIAEGDPRELRDDSTDPWVRQFFHREPERRHRPEIADEPTRQLLQARPVRHRRRSRRASRCCSIIGTGRWLKPRVTMETYFNESVQGLDIGSQDEISRRERSARSRESAFTYVHYELDKPMAERKRYVLVEAQLEPRLVGGTRRQRHREPRVDARSKSRRGLRVRLAPQGITGTSYLEVDYVDPAQNPVLPIDWVPDNIYIPSAPSTVSAVRQCRQRYHRAAAQARHRRHARQSQQAARHDQRPHGRDRHRRSCRSVPSARSAKIESTLDSIAAKKLSDEAVGSVDRAAADQRRAQGDARRSGVQEASRRHRRGDAEVARTRERPEALRSRSRTWSARCRASTGCSAAAKPISPRPSRTCGRSPTTCAT